MYKFKARDDKSMNSIDAFMYLKESDDNCIISGYSSVYKITDKKLLKFDFHKQEFIKTNDYDFETGYMKADIIEVKVKDCLDYYDLTRMYKKIGYNGLLIRRIEKVEIDDDNFEIHIGDMVHGRIDAFFANWEPLPDDFLIDDKNKLEFHI